MKQSRGSLQYVDDFLTLVQGISCDWQTAPFLDEAFFSKYKFDVLIDYFLQFGETLHPPVLHVSQRALTL